MQVCISISHLTKFCPHSLFQTVCPSLETNDDLPSVKWCRLMALSDGTILSQSPISSKLCTPHAITAAKIRISRDYRDGNGTLGNCNQTKIEQWPSLKLKCGIGWRSRSLSIEGTPFQEKRNCSQMLFLKPDSFLKYVDFLKQQHLQRLILLDLHPLIYLEHF